MPTIVSYFVTEKGQLRPRTIQVFDNHQLDTTGFPAGFVNQFESIIPLSPKERRFLSSLGINKIYPSKDNQIYAEIQPKKNVQIAIGGQIRPSTGRAKAIIELQPGINIALIKPNQRVDIDNFPFLGNLPLSNIPQTRSN